MNERALYKRKCDATGKEIISMYSPDKNCKVFDVKEWWSDRWDPLVYGKDYDFNKSFFEQIRELGSEVPRPSLMVTFGTMENSDYVNLAGKCKNCYLVFDSDSNQDCYYGYTINRSRNIVDSLKVDKSELCYECIDCNECYNLKFSINCRNCSDGVFLKNCIGCRNCFGCVNLNQKEFYFFNQQLSKDEYFEKLKQYEVSKYSSLKSLKNSIYAEFLKFPNKYMIGFNNIDCTGDCLYNCKNTHKSYDCFFNEDCKYCYSVYYRSKNCYDIYQFGDNLELCYEDAILGYSSSNVLFSLQCITGLNNIFYCQNCVSSHDLFGCIGLRHKEYCILNKQYTKSDYESLVSKIIEHMIKTQEWGEYFPISNSIFGYNETCAMDFAPISKEEALNKDYKWKDEDEKQYLAQVYQTPDDIHEVSDDITREILACEECRKNYKIIPQELKFYRDMNLSIPRKCPDCRHKERIALRNPRKLWKRNCMKCGVGIETTYAPERKEIVYCEKCYLEALV
ncbi:hypothetical protein A2229_02835 [Candidatus Peregrinibacteria bacterium RIFOXYA2_FULL_33_7]|nr:MAG: hypothetical protein A2229_02835 [Candidatus Peregrinibacteria bacterium RIFOXYA2_FULL_33_7]